MTVRELVDSNLFTLVHEGEDTSATISKPFCCDLLSIAMSKCPAGAAWVTVMANINTLAVASLTESACIILAEGTRLDEVAEKKAQMEGITIFETEEPVFEAACKVWQLIGGEHGTDV